MSIKVSLVVPTIRPRYWYYFAKSIEKNEIPYEILFIGPTKGDWNNLPEHVHYIKTDVKVPQCFHIGFDYAQGELVAWSPDDVFYHPKAIDNIYSAWKNGKKEDVYCPRIIEDNKETTTSHTLWQLNRYPMMAPFGFIGKDFFLNKIGGVDSQFSGTEWENDVVLRVYEYGGSVSIVNNAWVEFIETEYLKHSEFKDTGHQGRLLIKDLWLDEHGNLNKIRKRPVQKFNNTYEQILLYNQESWSPN